MPRAPRSYADAELCRYAAVAERGRGRWLPAVLWQTVLLEEEERDPRRVLITLGWARVGVEGARVRSLAYASSRRSGGSGENGRRLKGSLVSKGNTCGSELARAPVRALAVPELAEGEPGEAQHELLGLGLRDAKGSKSS
jgi:hypothetical protein